MKKIILIMVLIFFQSYILSLAFEKDSIEVIEYDSLPQNNQNSEFNNEKQNENKFYWTAVVGLGSTFGNAYKTSLTTEWNNGPVASFGFELSFSPSRDFSLEIYNFTGMFALSGNVYTENHDGLKISDTYYIKNLTLLFGLKFKLLSFMENDKITIMGNLDTPILPLDLLQGFLGIYNYGISINFYLSDQIILSLVGRRIFHLGAFFFGAPDWYYTPNLLILNYSYNF